MLAVAMQEATDILSFRDLIDRMGGILALRTALGLEYVTAQKMYQRDSVAVRHWPALIEHARSKGIAVGPDDLMRLKAPAPEAA